MLINWFTVCAQAINFLILVWLLKRFLYKPILHAIDEREKGIAAQLASAEAKTAEAQKDRDDFQHKNEAFDKERAALLKKATDDASAERQRLLDEAKKDADDLARQTPGRVGKSNNATWVPRSSAGPGRKSLPSRARRWRTSPAQASRNAWATYRHRPLRALDRAGEGSDGDRFQDVEPHGERS